jgi:hypothetical protein
MAARQGPPRPTLPVLISGQSVSGGGGGMPDIEVATHTIDGRGDVESHWAPASLALTISAEHDVNRPAGYLDASSKRAWR